MSDLSGISVVLPSLNPDEKLLAVVDGLLQHGFTDIILVNDGSCAENLHYFEKAAQHPEVHLLHHETNRGKGAALKTAFAWFLKERPGGIGVVTVDGDNQHHPEDTRACALNMLQTGHLTLGVRDFSQPDVPARSRSGNRITSAVFRIIVGMKLSDTQTGLRAIPRSNLEVLVNIAGDRFEYETNMLLAIKEHHFPFNEVKIRTVYIEENKSSHFHPIRDSWRIYKLLLAHFFKYALSSLISSSVDTAVFVFLEWALIGMLKEPWFTIVPVTAARITSSAVNFTINKRLVFHSNAKKGKSMLRYCILAISLFLSQLGLTYGIYSLFSIGAERIVLRGAIHVMVMVALFVVSYLIQENWVFSEKSKEK